MCIVFFSLATYHFKCAKEAYLQKDHLSAKKYSMIARQEHQLAEELINWKAAAEIFKFNNRKNKIWRIDLHGLHGMEAIKALQDRLDTIQSEEFLTTPSNDKKDSNHKKVIKHLEVITGTFSFFLRKKK